MSSVSHFRGHLFADLRGSTAFTQRAGNAAGAELVKRFRQMVRDEVGQHQGAEIKTEGDAIYVVFPSASMAVMCGLALVESADEATAEHPEMPIHMGVGIHAGEAVAVPEGGFIGTAVNLAARVSAVARAGEVLVTGTVREITQGSVPVTFVSRGKRRLKGIGEHVDLWRVMPEGAPVPIEHRLNRRLALGGAAPAIIALLAAALVVPSLGSLGGPATTPSPTAQALQIGPLEVGRYSSTSFMPPFSLAVTDPGWVLTNERAASAAFIYGVDTPPSGRVVVARLSGIHVDPCNPDGQYTTPVGRTPEDLIAALQDTPYLLVSEPTQMQIDRRPGLSVEIEISESVFAACDMSGGVSLFPLGSESFAADPSDRLRIQAIDVDGETVAFLMVTPAANVPVNEIQTFFGLSDALIDSIRF